MRARTAFATATFILVAAYAAAHEEQAGAPDQEIGPALSSSDPAQASTIKTSPDPTVLAFDEMWVPRWLTETVARAAHVTGVDPAYLMALADKESSLLPDNKARTSSAEGLFQFVEGTWLDVLRRYGPKHGYAAEAAAIQMVEGRPVVVDSDERGRILSLRRDPYLSALMAGEMINTHQQIMTGTIERDLSFAELYMAHLLGLQGARRFVALLSNAPDKSASKAFPRAAKANRALFFTLHQDTARKRKALAKALTIAEVHGRLEAVITQRVVRYSRLRWGLPPAAVISP